MMQLVTLAALVASAVTAGEGQQWTVGIEMVMSETELEHDCYSNTNSFVVAGTYRPMELLFVSLRLGFADVPICVKDGSNLYNAAFSDVFLWGLEVGSGDELGAQGGFWDAGMKLQHIPRSSQSDLTIDPEMEEFRFGLYGNLGMSWDTFSAYGGLRLSWVSTEYEDAIVDLKLSQANPFGIVVGFRETADQLTYSFELGLLDSLTVSVGAGISF